MKAHRTRTDNIAAAMSRLDRRTAALSGMGAVTRLFRRCHATSLRPVTGASPWIVDSNHRLSSFTKPAFQAGEERESNPRQADSQSAALPTELSSLVLKRAALVLYTPCDPLDRVSLSAQDRPTEPEPLNETLPFQPLNGCP